MRSLLAAVCLFLAGCGELDNRPLRWGTVRGLVVGADREVAFASLMGRTEERSGIEDDGSFELDEVPVGVHELVVVIDSTTAARRTVRVTGGSLLDLGEVAGSAASSVTVTLVPPGGQDVHDGIVWIDQFPLPAAELPEPVSPVSLGPLPPGCYLAKGFLPGLGEGSTDFCTGGGEVLALEVLLPAPTGAEGSEGCEETGCQLGLTCNEDGNCS